MRGKRKERKVRRMKGDVGRMVERDDKVLENTGNSLVGKEDTEVEMGDVGGHELVICEEVSWEEVVE